MLETEAALAWERALSKSATVITSELEFDRVLDPKVLRPPTRQTAQFEKVLATHELDGGDGGPPAIMVAIRPRNLHETVRGSAGREWRAGASRSPALLQKVCEKARSGQAPAATAPNGVHAVVYFNMGKNGKTLKAEARARRLLRILRTASPERQFFWPRGAAVVWTGSRLLARVAVTRPDIGLELQWHMLAMDTFGLEKAVVAAKWREQASAQEEDFHWTSKCWRGVEGGETAPGSVAER